VCRILLKPMTDAYLCGTCEKAFCRVCQKKGEGAGSLDWSIAERECKPWLRDMCAYHEHTHTKRGKPKEQYVTLR